MAERRRACASAGERSGERRRESCLSRRERARWRPVRPAVLAARSASRLESGLPAWPAVQTPGASRGRCSEEADASAPSRSGRPEGRLAGIRIASRHRQAPPGCRLVPGAAVGAAGSGQKRPEVSRSAPDRPVTAWNSASPRPPSTRQWPGSAGAWRSRRPGGGGPGAATRGGSGAVSDEERGGRPHAPLEERGVGGPRGTERRRRARVADRLPRMGFVSRSNFRFTEKPSRKSGEISGSPPTALWRGAFLTGAGLARVPRCRPRSTGDVRRARVVRMSDRAARHTRAIAVSHGAVSLPRSALCPTQPPRPLPAGPGRH